VPKGHKINEQYCTVFVKTLQVSELQLSWLLLIPPRYSLNPLLPTDTHVWQKRQKCAMKEGEWFGGFLTQADMGSNSIPIFCLALNT